MTAEEEVRPIVAVRALRERGLDQAEALLEHATPEQILTTCRRWDARDDAGPGLLAHWIRAGQFEDDRPPTPAEGRRARFDRYADCYPVGEVTEPHAALEARCWPKDVERRRELGQRECAGDMIVTDATFPHLTVRCDECGFETARSPHGLPLERKAAPARTEEMAF